MRLQKSNVFFVLAAATISNPLANAQISIPSYGEGITITTADNSAKINLGFRVQSLFTLEDPGSGKDLEYGMLIRRSRIKADGFFHDEKYGFKFEMGLSNRDIGNDKEIVESGYAPRLILDAVFK